MDAHKFASKLTLKRLPEFLELQIRIRFRSRNLNMSKIFLSVTSGVSMGTSPRTVLKTLQKIRTKKAREKGPPIQEGEDKSE